MPGRLGEGRAGFDGCILDVGEVGEVEQLAAEAAQRFRDFLHFSMICRLDEKGVCVVRKAPSCRNAMAIGFVMNGGEVVVIGVRAQASLHRIVEDVVPDGVEMYIGTDDGVMERFLPGKRKQCCRGGTFLPYNIAFFFLAKIVP